MFSEDANYPGIFWFPGQQEAYFSGRFTYTVKDGISLEIFDDRNEIPVFNDRQFDLGTTLHGFLIGKGPVTVCQIAGVSERNAPGIFGMESVETYSRTVLHITLKPLYAFVGSYFQDVETALFKHLSVRATLLDFWFDRFHLQHLAYSQMGKQMVGYDPVGDIRVWVEPIKAHLVFHTRPFIQEKGFGNGTPTGLPDAVLTHTDWIRIHPEQAQPIRWYLQQFHKIKQFVMLCLHKRIFFQMMTGEKDQATPEEQKRSTSVLYHQPELKDDDGLYPENLMLRLTKLENRLEEILTTFFKGFESGMEEIYKLFLAEHFHPRTNLTNRFLNICQALESYHARNYPQNKVLDPNVFGQAYKGPIKKLLKGVQIPDADPNVLSGVYERIMRSIGHANSPDLKDRLYDIFLTLDYGDLGIPDAYYFAQKVAKTRNYYTHYSDPKDILNPQEMEVAYNQLKLALIWVLYRDLGIPKESFFRHLQTSKPYQYMAWRQDLVPKPPAEKTEPETPKEKQEESTSELSRPKQVSQKTGGSQSAVPLDL